MGSHRRHRNVARAAVTVVGEILITLGVIVSLFVVYVLFYTNVEAARAQSEERSELREVWQPPGDPVVVDEPVADDFSGIAEGDGFAILYIPRFGRDFEVPVLEGIGLGDLARGVGHFPDTARPGELGNFALAGHRTGNGQPFHHLDRLEADDVVFVETENNWYRYVINRSKVVEPTAVEVVAPVPEQPGVEPTEELLTLVTCTPKWSTENRLIVWGNLESVQPKAAGTPAELLG